MLGIKLASLVDDGRFPPIVEPSRVESDWPDRATLCFHRESVRPRCIRSEWFRRVKKVSVLKMHLCALRAACMDKLHELALEAARQIRSPDSEFPELIELAKQLQEAALLETPDLATN